MKRDFAAACSAFESEPADFEFRDPATKMAGDEKTQRFQ
jgi:hypothetical protein